MKIAAIFGDVDRSTARMQVSKMCEAQIAHEWHTTEVFTTDWGAIGVVRTSERYGAMPMLLQNEQGNVLAISGVPTKNGKLKRHLEMVVGMSTRDAMNALTELDGAYAAVFWNQTESAAILVTDFMGFQPVYLHRGEREIAIASEIKAFSLAGIVQPKFDSVGWGAFVVFGHTVGEATQLEGVSRVRGVNLKYTPITDKLEKDKYWEWPDRRPDISVEEVPLEPIVAYFRKDIEAYSEYGADIETILMSSGFDSRLILCLLADLSTPVRTLSVQQGRHYFGAEGKLGQRIARHLGIHDAKLMFPKADEEGEIAKLRYMLMNDMATASLSLHVAKVAGLVEELSGAIWEGYAPGYTIYQYTDINMDSYLLKWGLHSDSEKWKAAAIIFPEKTLEKMQCGLRMLVEDETRLCGEDDYGVMRFIIRNRGLNRTAPNPFKVYQNSVLPFSPGLNRKLWYEVCKYSPLNVCNNWNLYKRVYKVLFPKALEVPFCSEKGLFTGDNSFNLNVWVQNLLYEIVYKWERRYRIPVIGQYIGKKITQEPKKSTRGLVDAVLMKVDLDDPHLNSDAVKSLLRRKTLSPIETKARHLLFYRTLWGLLMSGEISVSDSRQWLMKELEKSF